MKNKASLSFIKFLVEEKIIEHSELKGFYFFDDFLERTFDKIRQQWLSYWKFSDQITVPSVYPIKTYDKQQKELKSSSEIFLIPNFQSMLKPTSEAVLYNSKFFKRRVASSKLLPYVTHMENKVWRAESRSSPLIRHSEIVHFIEFHEAHTQDTVEVGFNRAVDAYSKLFNYLKIPYLRISRPETDRFPGSISTVAFDTVVGSKKLQIGTVHNLGKNFAKLYNLTYSTGANKEYIHQLSHGLSERVLAAVFYNSYNGTKLNLPDHLRLTALLLVNRPTTNISNIDNFVDKIYYIHLEKLNSTLERLKKLDYRLIVLINKNGQDFCELRNRDLVQRLELNFETTVIETLTNWQNCSCKATNSCHVRIPQSYELVMQQVGQQKPELWGVQIQSNKQISGDSY